MSNLYNWQRNWISFVSIGINLEGPWRINLNGINYLFRGVLDLDKEDGGIKVNDNMQTSCKGNILLLLIFIFFPSLPLFILSLSLSIYISILLFLSLSLSQPLRTPIFMKIWYIFLDQMCTLLGISVTQVRNNCDPLRCIQAYMVFQISCLTYCSWT